jgi:hypothetical protein
MPSSFVDSRINQNLEVATEYFKALVSEKTKDVTGNKINQSAGSIGFIPFNISFTMDGIGGIKIYNELALDTSFLPPGYTKTTDFIITGINHKIQNGDWETDINVTLVPRTSPITNVLTSSLQIFGQVEAAPLTPPTTTTPTGGRGKPPGITSDNARLLDSELVTIVTKNGRDYKLYKDAAAGYNTLKAAATAAGYNLDAALTSGYRDYATQDKLYSDYEKGLSPYVTAKPGTSNHGWGKAIDVSSGAGAINTWLRTNCVKYNWYWFGPADSIHFTFGYNESGYTQLSQQP